MNILSEANNIINNRSQEKDRQYGPFDESMDKMRDIFNAMSGLNLSTVNMYQAMIALKLSRESYCHKEDNLLDAVGYIGAMNNYIENQKPEDNTIPSNSNDKDDLPF